jgi:PAS domain S-box-containing protein
VGLAQSIVDAVCVPAIVVGPDGIVEACNDAAARLLDRPATAVAGRPFADLGATVRVDRLRAAVDDVRAGAPARRLSISLGGDDAALQLDVTVGPLASGGAARVPVLVTLQDVTRLGALEREVSALSAAEASAAHRVGESEARFRALLSSSMVGVFVADDEIILESNRAFADLVRRPPEDVAGGLRWRELTAAEYRDQDDRALRVLRETGECPPREKELVRSDGERVPVLTAGARVSAAPFSWVCFVIDLSARRRLERCREAEHAVARILAEAPPRHEVTPRILDALCRTLQWDVGELWEVQPGLDLLHRVAVWTTPDLADSEFARAGALLEPGPSQGLPGMAWQRGTPLLLEDVPTDRRIARARGVQAAGLRAGLGVPIVFGSAVIAVMTFFRRREEQPDEELLTALQAIGSQVGQFLVRTHGEQALALSERKARALLEQAAEGIVLIGADGRVEMINAKAESMFGYPRAEVLGQPLEILLPERYRDAHAGHRSSYFAAPRPRPMGLGLELAARRKDGSEFPVEVSLSYAETDAGRVAMAFVTDVTERRALERASRHAERLTALGTLAAGVAHELNNPIGILSSRIELMLLDRDALPPAVREDLEVLYRNAVRATQITQRLLSFARQPVGERRLLDVNALVQEALALVQPQIDRDGVRLRTELADGLPAVHGDPTALHQVLVNLLINAKEAMTEGDIVVRTRRAGEPGWIELSVADTGCGISPDVLARIFDPFYTTKPTGTGLGLAISYGIVREHQGRIDVESAPGKGTTFALSFPAIPAEAPGGRGAGT